jgi:hypothetical protein
MNKFVVVNDELRIGNVDSFENLYEKDKEEIKCKGHCKIIHRRKIVNFYNPIIDDTFEILRKIKLQGFYTPEIQGYKWTFSEAPSYVDYTEE